MRKCAVCCFDVSATWKCNSCSQMVCSFCMPTTGACCVECQSTFPVAPSTHTHVEPFLSVFPNIGNAESDATPSYTDPFFPESFLPGAELQGDCDPRLRSNVEGEDLPDMKPVRSRQQCNDLGDAAPLVLDALQTSLQHEGILQERKDRIVGCVKTFLEQEFGKTPSMEGARVHAECSQVAHEEPFKKWPKDQDMNHGARTMMICNIPCRVQYGDLIEAINSVGFGGTFEFVHLPFRFGQPESNLGYGFINFYHPKDAACFADAFEDYHFRSKGSTKACTVKVAKCQGYNGSYRRLRRDWRLAQQRLG